MIVVPLITLGLHLRDGRVRQVRNARKTLANTTRALVMVSSPDTTMVRRGGIA